MKKKILIILIVVGVLVIISGVVLAVVLIDMDKKNNYLAYELSVSGEYYIVTGGRTLNTAKNLELEIPSSHNNLPVKEIKNSAFEKSTAVSKFVLPDTVEKIGEKAFSYCLNLEDINIPNSVTNIGENAFQYCKIQEVNLPDNLESIKYGLFYNCSKIKTITIPKSVKSIGDYAFTGCIRLRDVIIEDDSNLLTIGERAFSNCNRLIDIDFGENSKLKSIETNAFAWCTQLTEIELPYTLEMMGNGVFNSTINLTDIEFENQMNWYIVKDVDFWKKKINGVMLDVSNGSYNVDFFKNQYYDWYWYRGE